MTRETKYFNAINQIPQIGPATFKKLLKFFPSMEEAWKADSLQLNRAGLDKELVEIFLAKRREISPEAEIEKLEKEKIKIVTIRDRDYPQPLKEIYNPPALFYIRGDIKPKDKFSLAIVGTRRLSPYGKQVAYQITSDLSRAGLTVISGLALGIDSLAHQAALENQSRTIAVLGSGLDNQSVYPAQNRYLAEQIARQGAVISEYPVGTLPLKMNFPARNRIISGLALGTLVIEAGETSGALITAREALEQNREVFAVPGSIYWKTSWGTNNLIKMGAKMVTSASDILEELNLTLTTEYVKNQKIVAETKEEDILLKLLSYEPVHIDQLIKQSKIKAAAVNSTLAMMEMKGKVRNLGGMNYVLAK